MVWTTWLAYFITTAYGFFTIFLYLATDYVILKFRKTFNSSFFQLYVYESFLNMFLFFVNYFSMRMSTLACLNCYLGMFYSSLENDIFLNFVLWMRYHMAYVQYAIILLISLNRLSVLRWNVESKWKYYGWMVVILICIVPFINTNALFQYRARFQYQPADENYALISNMPVFVIYDFLIPFMTISMILSITVNVSSLLIIRQMSQQKRTAANLNFILIMAITSVIQLVGTIISVALLNFQMHPTILYAMKWALPYVSESLTLVQPWLLIGFSGAIRTKFFAVLGFRKKTTKVLSSSATNPKSG